MWTLLACTGATVGIGPEKSPAESLLPHDSMGVIEDDYQGSCLPAGETVMGVELEALSATVACTGEGSADTLTVINLPEGAEFANGRLSWTPGLDQAGKYELTVLSEGPDGKSLGSLLIWVADAWARAGNEPVDPVVYQEEYGLPVLHLTRPDNTDPYYRVDSEMVYRGETYAIELKYRGASSLYYPKNSYTLYFPPDHEFEDDKTDFPKRRAIVLTSTFDDNAYFRQKMCYDLWNALDDSRHRIETRFVVVYINEEYEGLYLLGDHIDGEYWEDNGHFEDGNLYKSVDHSANFFAEFNGSPKSSLASGYEKKEGSPEDGELGAYDDLIGLVDWVISASDDEFQVGLKDRVAVHEFMDWWILARYTAADDSAGKNAYFYNDPAVMMWHFAPWDFNHSLGQSWQTDRVSVHTNNDFRTYNNLFNRMLGDPVIGSELVARYQSALAGPYSEVGVLALIDGYEAEMWTSALRDWEKWGGDYYSYSGWSWRNNWTTPGEELQYVRDWVTERTVYMQGLYP